MTEMIKAGTEVAVNSGEVSTECGATSISQNGYKFIKKFEGFRNTAYLCPAGIWTIGYGHTTGVKAGMSINPSIASEFLIRDCAPIIKVLNSMNLRFEQYQYDALASFIFNVGISAFIKSTLYKKLIAQDINASRELLKWVYIKGTVSNGLKNRRMSEYRLFNNGDYE